MPDRLARRPGLGRQAEALAADFLAAAGLRVVARNWCRRGAEAGELDIVADDNGTCVFVEVRSRTGVESGHPLETITPQKRARVVHAARLYLAEESPSARGYRFDVVAVTFWPDREPELTHIANAFEVGG
jgi:putative endonuclease